MYFSVSLALCIFSYTFFLNGQKKGDQFVTPFRVFIFEKELTLVVFFVWHQSAAAESFKRAAANKSINKPTSVAAKAKYVCVHIHTHTHPSEFF